MIAGILHKGSGLGNQLHRYVMTRVLALDKHFDWGMIGTPDFKGYSFLKKLDLGDYVHMEEARVFQERRVNNEEGVDIRGYDPLIQEVEDNTVIDGEFQDEKYFEHYRDLIDRWLSVEPLDLPERLCVISFRGGEYKYFPDLFLTQKYWNDAVENMRAINPDMIFKVVTDDPEEASKFFPDFEITHEIGRDWRHIRYARYLILSNSSFAILPAWLNQSAVVIAPKYWARHNVSPGYWALEQNKYKGWFYQDREGNLEEMT